MASYDHVINTTAVRHILKRHGAGGKEVTVRPITPEDIARVPELIRQAEEIRLERHAGVIVFRAQMPDGVMAVIEQIGHKHGRLSLKTMYFQGSAGPPPPRSVPREPPPALRPGRDADTGTPNIAPEGDRNNVRPPVEPNVRAARAAAEADALRAPEEDVDRSLFVDAQRLAAAEDRMVPVEGPDGSVRMVSARHLLEEAEEAETVAAEAAACLIGMTGSAAT